ncbi:MAG TPA: hypothetical protein VFM99_08210 [Chitinophagales bacterium]|nr:hypothetical protein [Chitinophagales bacterium]
MKVLYSIFLFILFVFSSCKQQVSWSAEQQNAFYEICYVGTVNNFDTIIAEAYCKCMLAAIMEKYPDPESIENISVEEMEQFANDCLQ